jgi:anti-anti-sigma factor
MQPPDLILRTSRCHDASVEIVPVGDLDMAATFKLEPEVERLLAQDGVRRLVIDLTDVRFIDSAGIGALLSIHDRAERLCVEMALANVPDQVRDVMAMPPVRPAADRVRSALGADDPAL